MMKNSICLVSLFVLFHALFAQQPGPAIIEWWHQGWHVRGPEMFTDTDAGYFAHREEDYVTTWGPKTSYRATIEITRYYGSASERATQVKCRLLPKFARLIIPAGDCDDHAVCDDHSPEVDMVYLNGHFLGCLTGADHEWVINSFKVPIEQIHFPAFPGDVGRNELEIVVDAANDVEWWYLDQYCQAIEIQGPAPVFLVHGWSPAGTEALAELQGILRTMWGIPSERGSAPMDNSPDYNAALLAGQLENYCGQYSVRQFNVIAHSKGGLDSRAMIDRNFVNSSHVKRLMQIATPNAGSFLADLLLSRDKLIAKMARRLVPEYHDVTDGMRSLTVDACKEFNSTHHSPRAPISTIIGRVKNLLHWDYYVLGKYCYNHDFRSQSWDRQGDGIVSVASAHALGTQLATSPLVADDMRYAHNRIVKDVGATGALLQFLNFLCESPSTSGADLEEGEGEVRAPSYLAPHAEDAEGIIVGKRGDDSITNSYTESYNMITKGAVVEAGQTAEIRFDLAASPGDCSFLILEAPRECNLRLFAPDGTAAAAELLPGQEDDYFWTILRPREVVLPQTQAGIYTLRIVNPTETPAVATVICRHPGAALQLEVKVDESPLPPRVTVKLLRDGATAEEAGLPLKCTMTPCTSMAEDEAEDVELPLTYAGNGTYVAEMPVAGEGQYLLAVSWLDSLGEVALQKQKTHYFCSVTGTLLPPENRGVKFFAAEEEPEEAGGTLPRENSNLAMGLRFGFDAIVSGGGDYALAGKLFSQDGRDISAAFQCKTSEMGGQLHFDLDFAGEEIYNSKCNGPYLLRDIQLLRLGENHARKTLATLQEWASEAFQYREFGCQPATFLDIAGEWLEKIASSESESQTILHLSCRTRVAPGYEDYDTFGATISTMDGKVIRTLSGAGQWQSQDEDGTVYVTELTVDTGELLAAGSLGPFLLDGFFCIGNDGQRCLLFQGSAKTDEYQPGQFEYHSAPYFMLFPRESVTIAAVPGEPTLFRVEIDFTRKDGSNSLLKPGIPAIGPFRIALLEAADPPGLHLVGGRADYLYAMNYEYLDVTEDILAQLRIQGNHDDFLDDGEAIRLSFQLRSDNGEPPLFSSCLLVVRTLMPRGTAITGRWTPKCLLTDLDEDNVISLEEAAMARKRWENGDLPRHVMLQTLEFAKYDGYHFDARIHDFMPGRE